MHTSDLGIAAPPPVASAPWPTGLFPPLETPELLRRAEAWSTAFQDGSASVRLSTSSSELTAVDSASSFIKADW